MMDYVPGLAGVPAAKSEISFIDGTNGILEYRGIAIQTLAEQSSYEEVVLLLLNGSLPTSQELDDFKSRLGRARSVPEGLLETIASFPTDAHPMNVTQTAVSALEMYDTGGENRDPYDQAVDIIAKVPTIIGAFNRHREGQEVVSPREDLGHAADFLRMVTGEDPDDLATRVMDVSLILHADHTMNASTFTARVTGSTGASPYSVVSAAVGSLSGALHGGANERVLKQLEAIPSKDDVRELVITKLAKGERIMGLGHRVYKTKDPRATILQGLATELFQHKGKSGVYDVAVELESVAEDMLSDKGVYPNVDFYSGIVYDKLGIPTDLFTPIFAVSRVAGWLAHWLEQMRDNRIFRPKQVYEGRREEPYVPISDR